MSCEICGRDSCAVWMHSLAVQERYEERNKMSNNIDDLRKEIQDLQDEVTALKEENEKSTTKLKELSKLIKKSMDRGLIETGIDVKWLLELPMTNEEYESFSELIKL